VLEQAIGLKIGLSIFRKRINSNVRFSHTDINGRVYWIQKFENPKEIMNIIKYYLDLVLVEVCGT